MESRFFKFALTAETYDQLLVGEMTEADRWR